MYRKNAEKLLLRVKEADQILTELKVVFENINKQHRSGGGHLEYAYLEHFLGEAEDVSYLFQILFNDQRTQKFLPIANRMLFEVILKSEHLIKLKNTGSDNEILSLLSKDMASAMSALDDAVGSAEGNPAADTLVKIHLVNKILGTDFDLSKIKSNTPTFPKIKDLCDKSSICIKDYCADKLYHFDVQWSWNNHSRLGNDFSLEKNSDYLLNNQAECFIEMYLKNIKLLSKHANALGCEEKVTEIMKQIGIQNI